MEIMAAVLLKQNFGIQDNVPKCICLVILLRHGKDICKYPPQMKFTSFTISVQFVIKNFLG